VLLRSLAPVQLLTEHGEVAVAGWMQQADRILGATDAYAIAVLEVDCHLAVEVYARIGAMNDADLDLVAVANEDRPVGQRMRAKRNQGDRRNLGMQDRAIGR
jgi:hypothetical protein